MNDLFAILPEDIFRPLAATNRRFYAALLMHLYKHTFDTAGDTPRRGDVIGEIGDFIDRLKPDTAFDVEADDGAPDSRTAAAREAREGQDRRRYQAYHVLRDTGWLVEIRDRYRKLVELTPEARMLLRELHRMVTGDTRSYGGEVLNVLSNLEAAIEHPDDRSETLRNAWNFSRDFGQHIRSLGARMRMAEDLLAKQNAFGDLLRAVFDDFIEKHAISDYKTLTTKHNPFRFRLKITARVEQIEADTLLVSRLVAAYVREGRAADAAAAEEAIRTALREIHDTFRTIDQRLDIINESQRRVERRLHTAVQYMDRDEGGRLERALRLLKAVCAVPVAPNERLDIPTMIVGHDPLVGGDSLFLVRANNRELQRTRARSAAPDPAVLLFEQAKEEYARRMTVTPTRVREFIEKALGDRGRVLGSEIEVSTVDDFIVFQRVREAEYMFDGYLSAWYRVDRLGDYVENKWMVFPEFAVERVGTE